MKQLIKKMRRKINQALDNYLDTNQVELDDYFESHKDEIYQNVTTQLNKPYINQLRREINITKRKEPSSYDFRYVETLEYLITMLKKHDFKSVRKIARNLMTVYNQHPSEFRAYSYFLYM